MGRLLRGARRGLLAAALLALTGTAAGCADVGLAPGVPTVQDWSALPGAPVRVVSAAHRDLRSTLGVQVVWQSQTTVAQTKVEASRIFDYVVDLGANEVGIDFYFATNGDTPTRVYREPGITPSPATIALIVDLARKHGLRVLLRPLLSEGNLGVAAGNWRGSIKPRSLPRWFASYYAFLRPYLVVARETRVTGFAIGTELDSLAWARKQWTAIEASAGSVYPGDLTFALNWNDWHKRSAYEPVPYVAVDAYPALSIGMYATVPQLTAAWVKWLDHQTGPTLRQTVLQEVGIAPADGAYADPATYGAAEPVVDSAIQRNWFAAACRAAKQAHVAGMFFYVVYNTDLPGEPASLLGATRSLSFTSISDSVIRACFASGWT